MNMKKALLFILVLALAIPAMAQTDIGFKGIGGRLGYVDPDGPDGTILFGVVADLGTWVPQLHWDASIAYWSSGEEGPGWDASWSDLAFRSTVKYHFIEGPWEPYAGGGIGLHMISFSYDYNGPGYPGDYDDSESDFALVVLGGVEHKFNAQWKGSAELMFDFGDAEQTSIQFNVIYMLGQ